MQDYREEKQHTRDEFSANKQLDYLAIEITFGKQVK